jgi:hypothetical protein
MGEDGRSVKGLHVAATPSPACKALFGLCKWRDPPAIALAKAAKRGGEPMWPADVPSCRT